MIDAIVQLLRNFLCCVKDLQLLPDSFIHMPIPTVLKAFFDYHAEIPNPLHLTTPLEFFICLTQFYAHYSATKSGYCMIQSGVAKVQYLKFLISTRQRQKNGSSTNMKDSLDQSTSAKAEQIIDESLARENYKAVKSIIVGTCILAIGICFFWLFANSLHVTSTDWIGGLPALMFALAVMEVALVPLLYYMLKEGSEKLSDSSQMKKLYEGSLRKIPIKDINAKTFNFLFDLEPFWFSQENSNIVQGDSNLAQQQFLKESKSIQTALANLSFAKNEDRYEQVVVKLKKDAANSRMEGWREYIYFVLNLLAFYGYLLCVVVYVWDDEENESYYISQLKLGMSHQDADWNGNFLGDFMWTVEPIVILASPFFFSSFTPSSKQKTE